MADLPPNEHVHTSMEVVVQTYNNGLHRPESKTELSEALTLVTWSLGS